MLVTACALLIAGCTLPKIEGRTVTSSLEDTATTELGRAIAPRLEEHPGKSGIYPLGVAHEAFAARALLADAAERSLDVQYYIWHGDTTGLLLFEALWQAAKRGVRVRVLLDDNSTSGLDHTIAALNAHDNIEVRLFNPLTSRKLRWFSYVFDFSRVNRRMHNKSFTADHQVTIVGGRNVGDEYFGAGTGVAFADLDVIAVGPIVREVSDAFDLYWNSASAYPAEALIEKPTAASVEHLQSTFVATKADPQSATYVAALYETQLVSELREGRLALEWADTRLVYDDPAKVVDAQIRKDLLLLPRLLAIAGDPGKQFDLISPYFVPMESGTASLQALAQRGVKVRILTNSLESTDVAAVHAGYAKRRKALLQAGIELYELKRTGGEPAQSGTTGGSSSASLHAKTFQLDSERIFVGSFNFDPRSASLNTELGVIIDSPLLAQQLEGLLNQELPLQAYRVQLSADGTGLQWIETTQEGTKIHDVEPGTSAFRRGTVRVMSWLPIEWLL